MTETPAPYGQAPQSDFESQFRRIFEATGCRTQAELGAVLDIRQASISDAKRRKSIPPEWIMKLFHKRHINPDWIYTGTGDMLIAAIASGGGDKSPAPVGIIIYRPLPECTTEELLAELMRRALKATG